MQGKNNLYRLRVGEKEIGYMQEYQGEFRFKGENMMWWLIGRIPKYDEIDEYVKILDASGNYIFEMDILRYKRDPEEDDWNTGVVVWDEGIKKFGVLDIDVAVFIPFQIAGLKLFSEEELIIEDQLYKHPQLKEQLGLRNL